MKYVQYISMTVAYRQARYIRSPKDREYYNRGEMVRKILNEIQILRSSLIKIQPALVYSLISWLDNPINFCLTTAFLLNCYINSAIPYSLGHCKDRVILHVLKSLLLTKSRR